MDRRPALPVAVDVDTSRVSIDATGVKSVEYERVHTEYDIGRFRAGYCCIRCFEPQETPFPERCVCGFEMRTRQAQQFAAEFDGPTTIGPARSLAELRAEDEEQKERARRDGEKPTNRIWLPS